MKTILKKLKNTASECCVTIILQTHRTLPDNEKDPIVLKNLIKDAEARLTSEFDKSFAKDITKRINHLANNINHRHNKESLILFVNENIAEYVSLPIHVENRVIIDKTFATRDLVRSLHKETNYYILLLSRDKARLIEALNDKVVEEIADGFPMENTGLNAVQTAEAAVASRQTNFVREFFNQVDKQLIEIQKKNPLPVIICTEESNYGEYENVTDRSDMIAGKIYGNRMHEKAHHIVETVWPVMKELNIKRINERLTELKAAVSSNNFLTDFNEIWSAVNAGKGKTLFVKQGYFQPAKLENNHIELVSSENSEHANVDDIIDEIIEINLQKRGDAVFIKDGNLEKFNGLALVTRY